MLILTHFIDIINIWFWKCTNIINLHNIIIVVHLIHQTHPIFLVLKLIMILTFIKCMFFLHNRNRVRRETAKLFRCHYRNDLFWVCCYFSIHCFIVLFVCSRLVYFGYAWFAFVVDVLFEGLVDGWWAGWWGMGGFYCWCFVILFHTILVNFVLANFHIILKRLPLTFNHMLILMDGLIYIFKIIHTLNGYSWWFILLITLKRQ